MVQRKFGKGGPFNPKTSGPYRDTSKIRGSAKVHNEAFKDCVTTMAQYVYEQFGRFPGTVPSMFAMMFLHAHHLDLEFYDTHFKPGAYLRTQAEHMKHWHSQDSSA